MTKTNFGPLHDQDYIPYQNSAQSKFKRKKVKNVNTLETNANKWTLLQNGRYLQFVKSNGDILQCSSRRKVEKVFLKMSNSVKTRTSDQCRSHHQKMIKHHENLEGVIRNLEERLQNVEEKSERMENFFEMEQLQKFQQKKLMESYVPSLMQNESETMKFEQKREQNLWGLLDKDAWVFQQIFYAHSQ